jgi:hypothetical protein
MLKNWFQGKRKPQSHQLIKWSLQMMTCRWLITKKATDASRRSTLKTNVKKKQQNLTMCAKTSKKLWAVRYLTMDQGWTSLHSASPEMSIQLCTIALKTQWKITRTLKPSIELKRTTITSEQSPNQSLKVLVKDLRLICWMQGRKQKKTTKSALPPRWNSWKMMTLKINKNILQKEVKMSSIKWKLKSSFPLLRKSKVTMSMNKKTNWLKNLSLNWMTSGKNSRWEMNWCRAKSSPSFNWRNKLKKLKKNLSRKSDRINKNQQNTKSKSQT